MDDKTSGEIQPGDIVYQHYRPANYGKVLWVDPARVVRLNHPCPAFYVRWKDGSETWAFDYEVKSLNALIVDHERKLRTHQETLAKAQLL